MSRIGVLLSGRGSNFLALHAAIERGEVPAKIVLVLSNRRHAPGIVRALERGVPAAVVPHARLASREAHDMVVIEALHRAGVDWVCLAGYMRLLTPRFVAAFPDRILNVHPSLLPAFPGLDAQHQAWEYGVKIAGCTVHLVDADLDRGPIVVQRAIAVAEKDTPASLADRILAEEHRAYPEALRRLLTEPWRIEGRRVSFTGGSKISSLNP